MQKLFALPIKTTKVAQSWENAKISIKQQFQHDNTEFNLILRETRFSVPPFRFNRKLMINLSQDVKNIISKSNNKLQYKMGKLIDLVKANNKKQAQVNALKKKVENDNDKILLAKQQFITLNAQYSKLSRTKNDLSKNNLNNYYLMQQIDKELEKLNKEFESLQNQTLQSNQEFLELEQETADMEKQIHQYNKEIKNLQALLHKQNIQNMYARNDHHRTEYSNMQLIRRQQMIKQILDV